MTRFPKLILAAAALALGGSPDEAFEGYRAMDERRAVKTLLTV